MNRFLGRLAAVDSRYVSALQNTSTSPAPRSHWVCGPCRAFAAQRTLNSGQPAPDAFVDAAVSDIRASLAQPKARSTTRSQASSASAFATKDGEDTHTHGSKEEHAGRVAKKKPLKGRAEHNKEGDQESQRAEPDRSYRDIIPDALIEKDTERLIRAFTDAAGDVDYIQSIPPTAFSQILRLLEPHRFLGPVKSATLAVSAASAKKHYMTHPDLQVLFKEYFDVLHTVLRARRAAGMPLSLIDYTILLRCAAEAGSATHAKLFWASMREDNIKPDVACWNAHLRSIVDNFHIHDKWKHRTRSTPHHANQRMNRNHASIERGYVGYSIGEGGVKNSVLSIWKQMIGDRLAGDEETYTLMMMATGREADLEWVNKILKNAWGIDVEGVMNATTPDIPTKEFSPSSPIRPTDRLLHTIAGVYGAANEVPTALRLVDFVSTRFAISIPLSVWEELLSWTWAASKGRTGRDRRQQPRALSRTSVTDLYKVMTAPPYNVQPSMYIHDLVASSWAARRHPHGIYLVIREALPLYTAAEDAAREARDRLKTAKRIIAGFTLPPTDDTQGSNAGTARPLQSPTSTPLWTPLTTLRRDCTILTMRRERSRVLLRRWIRLVLASPLSRQRMRPRSAHRRFRHRDRLRLAQKMLADLPPSLVPTDVTLRRPGFELQFRTVPVRRVWARRQTRWLRRHGLTAQELRERAELFVKVGTRPFRMVWAKRWTERDPVEAVRELSEERKTRRSRRKGGGSTEEKAGDAAMEVGGAG